MQDSSVQLQSIKDRISEIEDYLQFKVYEPYDPSLNLPNGRRLIFLMDYVYDGGDLDEVKLVIDRLLK